ncbi:MAG: hypothetical protein F4066_07450 [Chloroflexi bacterium]|nr:hypothetical protein [Chloroflexota bacterium]MYF81162.1 hypothetical protein [Chloroflexota bacterium]MYI04682.1 hypothetical protein [Chloroflexota bacterium]
MSGKRLGLVMALGVLALAGAALAVVLTLALLRSQTASALDEAVTEATEGHRFELLRFEFTHLPNRLLTEIARWFDDREEDEDAALERWFSSREESDRKAAERALERAIARSASGMGLDSSLPLFGDVALQWPPVDVDLGETLRVLAVSPRSEVKLVRTVLLGSDIGADEFERLEAIVEADGEWSAWVTTIGGVALYPAPVVSSRDYLRTLQIMAHEWTHHYLGFYPLGLSYARGPEMRTINETVADIVGDELGEAAALSIAAELPIADNPERQSILARTDPILRSLRLEVDELLAQGEVEEAERRMEAARRELIDAGRPFRKINQAFLAFRGGYGASASSASQWGPRLFALREASQSLAHFLEQVREINSPEEADRVLPR